MCFLYFLFAAFVTSFQHSKQVNRFVTSTTGNICFGSSTRYDTVLPTFSIGTTTPIPFFNLGLTCQKDVYSSCAPIPPIFYCQVQGYKLGSFPCVSNVTFHVVTWQAAPNNYTNQFTYFTGSNWASMNNFSDVCFSNNRRLLTSLGTVATAWDGDKVNFFYFANRETYHVFSIEWKSTTCVKCTRWLQSVSFCIFSVFSAS